MMSEITASALVYSRTFYCDYDAGFLLKPEDFSQSDVIWAKKYILSATSYCDELNGVRWVVFGNEKYLVFGVVGIISKLVENLLTEQEELKKYTLDEHGRNVKCFIGYVCHMQEKEKGWIPLAGEDDFVKIFTDHIAKEEVWKSVNVKRLQIGYQYKLKMDYSEPHVDLSIREMISGKDEDSEIFKTVLSEISNKDFNGSLCTNLYNVKMLEDECFSYITANKNIIERYKKKRVI